MDPKAMKINLSQDEINYIGSFCSRLNGSLICSCGANLTSRYCIWSYYQPLVTDNNGKKSDRKEN
mgnify:CR=1 FL=1